MTSRRRSRRHARRLAVGFLIAVAAWTASAPARAESDGVGTAPSRGADAELEPSVGSAAATYPTAALAAVGGTYGALYLFTYLAWYRTGGDSAALRFRNEGWFGPATYAGGADKLGHLWANYTMTRGVTGVLRWGGYPRTTSLLASAGLAVGFFLLVELKDGYEPQYGFSWGDVLFNVAGNALGAVMELSPELDRMFELRLEYWPSKYFLAEVERKGPFNTAEDYTGQRFLLSYHLASIELLRESPYLGWTQWLDLTAGYHARHYLPQDSDPNPPVRELFVGVSLDLHRVLERTLMPHPGSPDAPSSALRALAFAAEVVAVPYTTLPVGRFARAGSRDETGPAAAP